jgi:hypothetical protein
MGFTGSEFSSEQGQTKGAYTLEPKQKALCFQNPTK